MKKQEQVRTALAVSLHAAGENARYDAAVKSLLADKRILAWILKGCAEEFRDMGILEIMRCIEGSPVVSEIAVLPDETEVPKISGTGMEDVTVTEWKITFDIRFRVHIPVRGGTVTLLINIEAQNDFYPGYPLIKRAIYYVCRMISSQYGTVFQQSHYEKIQKVYSVWICANPPKARRNTITRYYMEEENLVGGVKERKVDYDLLSVVVIGLGRAEEAEERSLLRLLDMLLSTEFNGQEKQKILEQEFEIPMTEKLERQVDEMCNLSKGVEEKGIAKGIIQGMEQGAKQGAEQAMLSSVRNLMETLEFSVEQAMDALKVPEQKKEKYRIMLCGKQ